MSTTTLRERVEKLESELNALKLQISSNKPVGSNWREAIEEFKGNEDLISVLREAERRREVSRKAARSRNARLKRKK